MGYMIFLIFLLLVSVVIWFVFIRKNSWYSQFVLKPYFISLELDNADVVLEIEPLLDQFKFKMKDKVLVRDDVIRLELRYDSHPIAHHLFLKRVYSIDAIGKIVVI